MSDPSAPEVKEGTEISPMAETVQTFASYSEASIAACKWVNSGKTKIDPAQLILYTNTLSASPAYGKIVGVGLKFTAEVDFCRLDMDNTGKGIHFNAKQRDDQSKKLAAVIQPTIALSEAQRTQLYMEYIKGLENRSAQFIWEWWSTGKAPA
ncbi:hypothetical protein NLJ89_g7389 [Agrocybe chaxingu]|uniref:Uncharacterized protein n=1 Tax=Agrocybe chaxingu TaxID=84603 RepID=A0A9W8MT64_9AGAR|nr:hypothetical protein NLJ89_g7389 [Agrocybe chaxingu]